MAARWLEQLFGIRRDELPLVLSFFGFFTGVGMLYTVASTVGDTLFLSNLPPADVPRKLPWVYVGIAAANVASTIAFDAMQARVSRHVSIIGTQLGLAVSVLGARVALEADQPAIYFALLVWLETCSLLSVTLFFSFAGDYFTPRDARRLYGFIAGGMAVGTVLMGHAIQLAVALIGTANLLFAGAAILALNALVCGVIFRIGAPALSDVREDDATAMVTLSALAKRPYVRALLWTVPLALVMYVTVDYQMKWVASAMTEADLARFFGSFYGFVGAAQIAFQFLLVPRLLKRFGVVRCLMILPLLLALTSLANASGFATGVLGIDLLLLLAGANFLRITLAETLEQPSRELLFLPLPARARRRAQPLFGGVIAPSAQGLAGLLLLGALAFGLEVRAISLLTLACATVLLFSLSRLRPLYRDTLAAVLRDHQLDATDLEQVLQDAQSETVLAGLLASNDREVVKATLELLEQRPLGRLTPLLEKLAQSPDTELAIAALRRLGKERDPRFVPAIERAWRSEDAAVRSAAVLALCEASGPSAIDRVSSTLSDRDPELRESAMIGIARHCGEQGEQLVLPGVRERAESPIDDDRAAAAALIGRIGSSAFAELLARLIEDSSGSVRAAAVEAAAQLRAVSLVPTLLRALLRPELRGASLRALSAMPKEAVPALSVVVSDTRLAMSGRCALARVLGSIGGVQAVAALWEQLDASRPLSLRFSAAEALRGLNAKNALPSVVTLDVEPLVDDATRALELLTDAACQIGSTDPFVANIYRDHAAMHVELLFALIGITCSAASLERMRHNVLHEPREVALQALELLDEVLPHALASNVSAALQRWLEADWNAGTGLAADIKQRLLSAEPWVRVAAVRHANQGAAYPTIDAGALADEDRDLYTRLELVRFLKEVPLLRDIPAYYLIEQAELAEWQALAEGETLFHEGEVADALFIVGSGRLEVRVADKTVATLTDGECIGELALLDGEPRSATIVARSEAVLLRVSAERFRNLLLSQSAASKALLRTLDRRIRETQAGARAVPAQRSGMRRSQFMRSQQLNLSQLVSTMSFLRQVELFRDLGQASLANLAGIAQEVIVYQGDVLFEEGEEGESLYLVCSGSLSIVAGERQVATLERGACVGEMALLSGLPRSASAIALTEGRLLRIGSDDFMSLLGSETDLALGLLKTLAQRLRQVSKA